MIRIGDFDVDGPSTLTTLLLLLLVFQVELEICVCLFSFPLTSLVLLFQSERKVKMKEEDAPPPRYSHPLQFIHNALWALMIFLCGQNGLGLLFKFCAHEEARCGRLG